MVLKHAIEEIVEIEQENANMRMNEIKVTIGLRVPEVICTDLDRFQQVLLNLLSNANKFTREGKINILCLMAHDSDATPKQDKNVDSHLVVYV